MKAFAQGWARLTMDAHGKSIYSCGCIAEPYGIRDQRWVRFCPEHAANPRGIYEMKAFHFELADGERGTLAGCDDDCTLDDAREWIEFFYRGRVVEVRQAGIVMNAPPTKDLRASYIKAMRQAASGCAGEG